jgi:hypothetical protein
MSHLALLFVLRIIVLRFYVLYDYICIVNYSCVHNDTSA